MIGSDNLQPMTTTKSINLDSGLDGVETKHGESVMFSLVILKSSFEATRGHFWDEPRDFEPQSDVEDGTCARIPLSKPPDRTNGWPFAHYV
ncbi:hypothetical protein AVEN_262392-1 [Araneus ventricosus]|uniref:Uncharacterized protein n=1 Tax=Araneus ventricosus TaxID=182803 RepID=A0A4Y2IJJ8_ARAVE|nr:hypothetical protein AVEN_262392-1 [Araneus ventricosus]